MIEDYARMTATRIISPSPQRTRSVIFFFFSSRRRHTRCSRDWSSDVCSSDLQGHEAEPLRDLLCCLRDLRVRLSSLRYNLAHGPEQSRRRYRQFQRLWFAHRSEERRVGKECRSRWSPDHLKKKISNNEETRVI